MNRASSLGKDLLQDLRDRNLLIPAIALVVLIVAVPVLLGSGGSDDSSSSGPAVTSAPESMSGSAEIEPVVLAEVPGLRDYRKRLSGGNGRNPFIQQSVDQPSDEGDGGGSGSGGSGGSGGSSSSTASTSDTSSSTSSSSTPSTPTTPDSSGGGTTPDTEPPKDKLIKFTIDVRVGRVGETKVLRDVEPLSMLPGNKRPIVQYINSKTDGSRAGFVVSPYLLSSEGDGKCDPGRNNCQYLWMEEGDSRTFVYGDHHDNYRLELLAIDRKIVPLPDATG